MITKSIPIFFHSSAEYCPMMAVTMTSILYNTKSFIEFYIIETGISEFNKKQIESMKEQFPNFSIEWIKFEYNDIFKKEYFEGLAKNLEGKQWPSVHAFCTPFMPILKPNLDKFIYLDIDTICAGDIQELYDEDLEDFYIGGVADAVVPLVASKAIIATKNGVPYTEFGKYFNAGVLLINAKLFIEDNIIEKYMNIATTKVMPICDQDVLNYLFGRDKFKSLNQKFNVIFQPQQEHINSKGLNFSADLFIEGQKNMVIRHFAGIKPWEGFIEHWTHRELENRDLFWKFAKISPYYSELKVKYIKNIADIRIKQMRKYIKYWILNCITFNLISKLKKRYNKENEMRKRINEEQYWISVSFT